MIVLRTIMFTVTDLKFNLSGARTQKEETGKKMGGNFYHFFRATEYLLHKIKRRTFIQHFILGKLSNIMNIFNSILQLTQTQV